MLVIPVAEDESERMLRLTVESSGLRDAVLCLDEHARIPWAARYGHVVRARGFGMGRALEEGFRYAFRRLGAEWVVKSDAHVRFLQPAGLMLRPGREGFVVRPLHYAGPEMVGPWYGLIVDYETWEFRYVWEPRPLPVLYDPVYALHRSSAELLWSVQGRAFMVPYWGKEVVDLTLTLSRWGRHVAQGPEVGVVHYYKRSWPAARLRVSAAGEPWAAELRPGECPYFLAVSIGDAIFAFRHYPNPRAMPFWRTVPERAAELAARYFPGECRPAVAPLTAEEAYRRLGF